jgi:glycine cleavage system aminomethyltransferase T
MMKIGMDSSIMKGARNFQSLFGTLLPSAFTGPRDEFLACRETAWLGVTLNSSPVFDIFGPDAVKFLNSVCVNKDFGVFPDGTSKHVLICNDRGKMLADGVMIKTEDNHFRTYWLAPVIHYYMMASGMDVQGEYVNDEYFFQIDGPKSLEIMEKACQCDLHDIKFARNKKVKINGTDMLVHRLGMSGALAYEVHGKAKDAEVAYTRIREVLEEFGGKLQGFMNYPIINHTVGGYPNQFQHFWYPLHTSGEGLSEFFKKVGFFQARFTGSASDNVEDNFYVTPYDVGWGYLVNFDHDFMGKEELMKIAKNPPRKIVTLEWNAEDVGDVFMSQFRGKDVEPYEGIEYPGAHFEEPLDSHLRGDYVLADGKKIGVATGKTYAYHERRMISLAVIDKQYATQGNGVVVLWGSPGRAQKEIRAKVARYPYYDEEYRNETFDTEKIRRPKQNPLRK